MRRDGKRWGVLKFLIDQYNIDTGELFNNPHSVLIKSHIILFLFFFTVQNDLYRPNQLTMLLP